MAVKEVLVPDLGGTKGVDVIELSVQPGDHVEKEDTLLVLESDKATVEVPSPFSGVLTSFSVSVGQTVQEGDLLAKMETGSDTVAPASEKASVSKGVTNDHEAPATQLQHVAEASVQIVKVPDIGGTDDIDVIEVVVEAGDTIEKEQTMIVLESDKATMEVPCPQAGTVRKVLLKVGDKVSQGTPVLEMLVAGAEATVATTPAAAAPTPAPTSVPEKASVAKLMDASSTPSKTVHAGPAVRRLARELGVDLAQVKASGPRARILKDDVHGYVKQQMTGQASVAVTGNGLPPLPEIDFAKWGEIETVELSKINKASASNLHRAWVHIPHVTQFDEADITALDAFRKAESASLKEQGVKLTVLAFLVKACAKALQVFPRFNSSLHTNGNELIFKKYIHIGIAVDTPNGLVVPVIRNADQKTVVEIAQAMQALSEKARTKKLMPADMQGGTISISSLGGIGGTAFTPIVNWPEVAIVGVSRSQIKPVYNGATFEPRLMLPLSVSYDHRVIDGAEAARFTTYLSQQLSDIRRLLL